MVVLGESCLTLPTFRLGILLNCDGQKYVVPLSSAKEKHKSWRNVETDRFVLYENCSRSDVRSNDIFTQNEDGTVKHILSVIAILRKASKLYDRQKQTGELLDRYGKV